MLEVQNYLRSGKTLDDLQAELAIRVKFHDTLPLAILNYDQLDSPKTHPIIRECRGLTLDTRTWNVAARSFPRFFNVGEVQDEMPLFDWNNCSTTSKEDGSLCLFYNFEGQWRVNTRGSFAEDLMPFQPFTWTEAIVRATGCSSLQELGRHLAPGFAYVCEFCSLYNKVVREYREPVVFWLTVFHDERELTVSECDAIFPVTPGRFPFQKPQRFDFHSIEEVQDYLHEQSESDPTYEGVVLRDQHNHRWKVKNPKYLALHRLSSNGNLFNPKYLLPFMLTGETDELLVYFKETEPALQCYQQQFDAMVDSMRDLWAKMKDEPDQKMFALGVKGHPLSSILFTARKEKSEPEKALRNNPNIVLKNIKLYAPAVFEQKVGA